MIYATRRAEPVALDVPTAPRALKVITISAMRLLALSVAAARLRLTARVSSPDIGSLREHRIVERASLIEHVSDVAAGPNKSSLSTPFTSG